jgi:hypothetical protein
MPTRPAIDRSAFLKRTGKSTVRVCLNAGTGSGAAKTGCIDSSRVAASTAMVGNVTAMALDLRPASSERTVRVSNQLHFFRLSTLTDSSHGRLRRAETLSWPTLPCASRTPSDRAPPRARSVHTRGSACTDSAASSWRGLGTGQ